MADVTQAPFPLKLGGQEYHLSPLTDVDIEELNNWLRSDVINMARMSLTSDMNAEERAEVLGIAMDKARGLSWMSGEGAAAMASLSGIARVLWQGLKARHPELTPKKVQELIMDKGTLDYAMAIWNELNLGPVREAKTRAKRVPKSSPPSKEEIYVRLAERFHWSTHDIRHMTPWTQLAMHNPEKFKTAYHFDTDEEYMEWLSRTV